MARKGLRATNFSFSEIKISSKVRSVEVGKRCCPSSRAIQGQRVERQRRKGEQLHCRQSGRPCFRPGKGSFQRLGTSRLGAKGESRNRQTQGSTRHVHYPRKVPTFKKFAVKFLSYSFQNHIKFSQFCYFVTVAWIAWFALPFFWILVYALGSPWMKTRTGYGSGPVYWCCPGVGKAFSNWNNPVSMDENRNNAAAFWSINVESIIWSLRQYRTGQI